MYKTNEKTLKAAALSIGVVLAFALLGFFLNDFGLPFRIAVAIGVLWFLVWLCRKGWWGMLLSGVIMVGIMYFFYEFAEYQLQSQLHSSESSNSNYEYTPPVEIISCSPGEILRAYEANEVKADQLYRGKQIRTYGVAREIKRDLLNQPYVLIQPHLIDNQFFGIQCYFDESNSNQAANVQVGQSITVEGVGGPHGVYTSTMYHSKIVSN